MTRALLAAGAVVLAGCGGQFTGAAEPATLEVVQRFAGDAVYIEGSLSYIRLEGAAATEERLDDGRAEVQVASGSYVLHSWQRPCNGNCGLLDPPTDRCSESFEAGASDRLRASIVVRPGEGCTIEVR